MNDCNHPKIRTWFFEDGQPASFWSCAVCRVKFVPITQLVAEVEAEREACAAVCKARYMGDNNREDMEARRCAAAIRARTTP